MVFIIGDKVVHFPSEEQMDYFPGKKTTFVFAQDEANDSVIFTSTTSDSFFYYLYVDFENKSVTIRATINDLSPLVIFDDYFARQGFSDKTIVGQGKYTVKKTGDVQKLCGILLANSEFPEEWKPFFQSLAKDGHWIINSKNELRSSL